MRGFSLRMARKAVSSTLLITLILLMSLFGLLVQFHTALAEEGTVVRVFPGTIELGPENVTGHEFKIAVVVENVSNLYGIDIQLSWNTTYLAYVNHTATVGVETFDTPIPPSPYAGVLHEDILIILDDVNETAGTYRIACASLGFPPPPSFNGSGTAFVMAFKVIDQPAADEEDVTLQLHFTIHDLAERHGMIIDHVAIDGTIIIYAPVMAPVVSIYTDKYIYHAGETMHLGLDIVNPGIAVTVCVAIWLERPVGGIRVILHAHAITLPTGLNYSDPNFMTFMLPSIPTGIYTWHAALLEPTTHSIIVEDIAEWQFS